MKGDEPVDKRVLDVDGTSLFLEFRVGRKYSYDELAEARKKVDWVEVIKIVPGLMGSGTDQSRGEIVLLAQENDANDFAYIRERVGEIFWVPVRFDFIRGILRRSTGRGEISP